VTLDAHGAALYDPAYLLNVGEVVSATYGGDARWGWSAGEAPVDVVPARTATMLSIEPSPALAGDEVTVNVEVANLDTDIPPYGSVSFAIDGQRVGAPFDLDEEGRLTLTVRLSGVEPGEHRVTVGYEDDTGTPANFTPSAAAGSVRVTAPQPTPTANPAAPAPTAAPAGPAAPRIVTAKQLRTFGERVAAALRRRGLAALRRASPAFTAATAGTLRQTVLAGRTQVASGSATFRRAGTRRVNWRLSTAGRRLIEHGRAVRVVIRTTFVAANRPRLAVTTKARARATDGG